MVDGGRNTNGDLIGSTIGNDKLKIECAWGMLTSAQFNALVCVFDRASGGHFINTFRVFDIRKNDFCYLLMYVSDRSGTPAAFDPTTGAPTHWKDVKCNLVEV